MPKPAEGSPLRQYLDDTGSLPRDAVIGHIVMFTIIDTPIERAVLEKHFIDLGLDLNMLPPEISPLDAFKKATSEAKDIETLPNGNIASVLCRELSSTQHAVTRQITREVRDSNKRELSYSKGIECVFFRGKPPKGSSTIARGSERVRIGVNQDNLDTEAKASLDKIADEIQRRYLGYYRYLDGNKLRAVVRNYLKHLNAIELRGGVYFVHANRLDELAKVSTLVERIGNGCVLQSFPLVDLPNQRAMIVEAFQKDAAGKLDDIIRDIADLKANRKSITSSAYAKLKERYDVVVNQANEYLETLELSQDVTGASAELALDALTDLQVQMLKEQE